MKVRSATEIHIKKITPPKKRNIKSKKTIATGTGIDIRSLKRPIRVIKDNNSEDPLVSKKILDSLKLGLINFSQEERDVIAKILSKRARIVKESRTN